MPVGPLERLSFETSRLMAEHQPVWRDRNKLAVFEVACPPGCSHTGPLIYTRWPAMTLPDRIQPTGLGERLVIRQDTYDYAPASPGGDAVEWHVNFADMHLFVAYGSRLFAQDEMQVAEHPVLGALREALISRGLPAVTVENGSPTPVLVAGAERRCRVATNPDSTAGRPRGLYGNAFGAADPEVVRRATTPIVPPTNTNLIAMAAPAGGSGTYSRDEIERVLITAYTGFRAATLESQALRGPPSATLVHTGFWGCGAFGGNRVLMAALQILAAQAAQLERMVFHTVDSAGTRALHEAKGLLATGPHVDSPQPSAAVIDWLASCGFPWGVSDGN
jgi:hypothetical protein